MAGRAILRGVWVLPPARDAAPVGHPHHDCVPQLAGRGEAHVYTKLDREIPVASQMVNLTAATSI